MRCAHPSAPELGFGSERCVGAADGDIDWCFFICLGFLFYYIKGHTSRILHPRSHPPSTTTYRPKPEEEQWCKKTREEQRSAYLLAPVRYCFFLSLSLSLSPSLCIYIYIYIYVYTQILNNLTWTNKRIGGKQKWTIHICMCCLKWPIRTCFSSIR